MDNLSVLDIISSNESVITNSNVCQMYLIDKGSNGKKFHFIRFAYIDFIPYKQKDVYLNENYIDNRFEKFYTSKFISDVKSSYKEAIDICNNEKYWFKKTIDLNEYSKEDLIEIFLNSYYSDEEIKKLFEKERYGEIANCIFCCHYLTF